jgi:hypothetical protein
MHFSRAPRFARLLSVAAALTCAATLTACGEGLEDDESALADDETVVETTDQALGGRNIPGDAPVVALDGFEVPQEAPVCQDCEIAGAVGLTTIGGMPHVTLRGVSAGSKLNAFVGAAYIPTGDYIYVLQRQFVNGAWRDVPVWQSQITGFDHIAWARTWNSRTRLYSTSTGVTLNAAAMSLATVEANLRGQMAIAANWRGAAPLFKAVVFVNGPVLGGGVRMPVPFL